MLYFIKDSSTGKTCNAKLWFSLVSSIVLIKYSLATVTIFGMTFGEFDAQGASMLIGVFGGMYGWRAQNKSKAKAE